MQTYIDKLKTAFQQGDVKEVIRLSQAIASNPAVQYDATESAKELMAWTVKVYVNAEDMDFDTFFDKEGELIKHSFRSGFYPTVDQLSAISYSTVVPLMFERNIGQAVETYLGLLIEEDKKYYIVTTRYAFGENGRMTYTPPTFKGSYPLHEVSINNHEVGVIYTGTRFDYFNMDEEFKFWHVYLGYIVEKYLVEELGLSKESFIVQKVNESIPF